MGRSTVTELMNKGKSENAYNNSGIKTPAQWMDFFNDALNDLVDDLNLTKTFTVTHDGAAREYDLPDDFYSVFILNDQSNGRVAVRRNYDANGGYWVMYKGSKYVIDLWKYTSAQTFNGVYQRYATKLTDVGNNPEVPDVGEKALIYYALGKALRNNNQVGQAKEMDEKYEAERLKIRNAAARARA